MVAWLWGGAIRFPDAPITECATGYCGKWSSRHTSEDYRLFRIWERALWIGFPIGMLVLLVLNRKTMRLR
jgi:hypothetical protein